ncbi:MAG: helix-turn-helix transcriptional regulator [Planctomycetota bacterium]|nr:helix-turn-helix transcriptional regulator [Planctomycetota bacterium]
MAEPVFTESEVRRLLTLSRRLAGAGVDVAARKQILLSELCRLVGAVAGLTAMLADDFSVQGELTVVRIDPAFSNQGGVGEFDAITTISMYPEATLDAKDASRDILPESTAANPDNEGAREVLAAHGREVFGMGNPLIRPLIREAASRMFEPTALARSEAVDDKAWYSSEFFRQSRLPFGLDDCILSVVPLPGLQPFINVVCLSGPLRSTPSDESSVVTTPYFSARQRHLIEFAHSELRWIHYSQERAEAVRVLEESTPPLQSDAEPVASTLSPRLQRVLRHLLTGESEKEIATGLGLSRHTVHEYVRALYRQFGVTSRGELMAHWVQTQKA